MVVCSLQLKLISRDAKRRGNFLAGGLARLRYSLLLGKSRLRNAHAFGHLILCKVQVFAPGPDR